MLIDVYDYLSKGFYQRMVEWWDITFSEIKPFTTFRNLVEVKRNNKIFDCSSTIYVLAR